MDDYQTKYQHLKKVLLNQLSLQVDHRNRLLHLDTIRRKLKQLPSTLFVVKSLGQGTWQFSGGGFGHGAGLSQSGAIDLAERGWTLERILSHYFPGANYGSLPVLGKDL